MTLPPLDVAFSVLGYEEDEEWVALALEMDLRGYGDSFEEAVADLADLVAMQISFAFFKGQPEMIWKPAEPIWFSRFAEVRRDKVLALFQGRSSRRDSKFDVAELPIPSAQVIEERKSNFLVA